MLDLNQLINQNRILKKYQGDLESNIIDAENSMLDIQEGIYQPPVYNQEVIPGYNAPGDIMHGTGYDPNVIQTQNILPNVPLEDEGEGEEPVKTIAVPEIEIWGGPGSEYSEYGEDLNVRLDRYNIMYNEYLETGILPDDFVPFGELEFGYLGGDYVVQGSDVASVWRVNEETLEQYDNIDVPINEWLFGIVESQEDIEERIRTENMANAPSTDNYLPFNTENKAQWQSDTKDYWDKIHDEKYSKIDGWYKNAKTDEWEMIPYLDVINQVREKVNVHNKKVYQQGITAGVAKDPDYVAPDPGGLFSEETANNMAAAAAVLIADDATVVGILDDVILPFIGAAMALDAATKIPWGNLWDEITSTGYWSSASIASRQTLKDAYNTIRSLDPHQAIMETVNGVVGMYVATNAGEIFVSQQYIDEAFTASSVTGRSEADEAYEQAYPGGPEELELEDVSGTMSGAGGEEPPSPDDENRWSRFMKNVRGWGKNRIQNFKTVKNAFKDYNPFGKTMMKETASILWKDAAFMDRVGKIFYLGQGKTLVGRWATRMVYIGIIDEAQHKYRGTELSYFEQLLDTDEAQWDRNSQNFINIMLSDSSDIEKAQELETAIEEAAEEEGKTVEKYIQDSVLFEHMKYQWPKDSLYEFESGYKGYGEGVGGGEDFWNLDFKKGGLVHNPSDQMRQFQEGGVMSNIRKYQGNYQTSLLGSTTIPRGFSFEYDWNQQPAITPETSLGTYVNYPMTDWKHSDDLTPNVQPTEADFHAHGFQDVQAWRDWVNKQSGFEKYDWGKLGYWGPKHDEAWRWTTGSKERFEIGKGTPCPPEKPCKDQNGTCIECGGTETPCPPETPCKDALGNCIECGSSSSLSEEDIINLEINSRQSMFKDIGGKALHLGASLLPAAFAWGQANRMEDEAHEFLDIPNIKSPEVHIKAPINEINEEIENVDTEMNAVLEKLKNTGASAAAILTAEKHRRVAKNKLTATKTDLLLKADAESQKLTAGYKMDAAKQNQLKDIKMKLEEMDFRTATKKAKIDILQKLTNTISGFVLDEKKMFSDKNITAIVTSAIVAGTTMADRRLLLTMMTNMGYSEDQIRSVQGGEVFFED